MPDTRFEKVKKELQTHSRRVTTLLKLLRTYEKESNSKSNPYILSETLGKIRKILPEIPLNNELKQTLLTKVEKEAEIIEQMKARYRYSYMKGLGDALKQLNLNLSGQYPNLYAGLFTFRPNFQKGTIKIFWCTEEIGETKLLPSQVLKTLKNFMKSLDTPFVAKDFYMKLKEAYNQVLKTEGNLLERRAPIVGVLQKLVLMQQGKAFWANPTRRNFKEYSRVQFAYDLYRLRRSSFGSGVRLVVATFDQTRDPTKAIFVPDSPEHGTRYAYIIVD